MQVGDLLKPRCQLTFVRLGFAILLEIDEGLAIIHWLDDQTDNHFRLWDLQNNMEVV